MTGQGQSVCRSNGNFKNAFLLDAVSYFYCNTAHTQLSAQKEINSYLI